MKPRGIMVLFLLAPCLQAAHVVHVSPQHYDHPLDRDSARATVAAPARTPSRRPPASLPYLVCGEPRLLRFARPVKPAIPLRDLSNADFPAIDTGKPAASPPAPPSAAASALPPAPARPVQAASAPPPAQPEPLILGDDLRRDYLPEDILPYFRAPYLVIPPQPPLPSSKATYQQQ